MSVGDALRERSVRPMRSTIVTARHRFCSCPQTDSTKYLGRSAEAVAVRPEPRPPWRPHRPRPPRSRSRSRCRSRATSTAPDVVSQSTRALRTRDHRGPRSGTRPRLGWCARTWRPVCVFWRGSCCGCRGGGGGGSGEARVVSVGRGRGLTRSKRGPATRPRRGGREAPWRTRKARKCRGPAGRGAGRRGAPEQEGHLARPLGLARLLLADARPSPAGRALAVAPPLPSSRPTRGSRARAPPPPCSLALVVLARRRYFLGGPQPLPADELDLVEASHGDEERDRGEEMEQHLVHPGVASPPFAPSGAEATRSS